MRDFRYIFVMICGFIAICFSSCSNGTCTNVGEYFVGNDTDKEIAIVYTSKPYFKVRILSNSCTYDTIDTLYTDNHQNKYWRRLTKFYIPPSTPTDSILELIRYEEADEYTCHYDEPYIEVWKIYNLEDTTSIKKGELGKGLYCRDSDIDSFVEITSTFDIIKHEKAYWTYRLTVTDSLLSLMQKDTSMLRLFPDYYGGE